MGRLGRRLSSTRPLIWVASKPNVVLAMVGIVSAMEIQSARLTLRAFREDDASLVLALMNEPAFHRYIGDRGIRSLADASRYLRDSPMASYREHGYGLLHVSRTDTAEPIGMCGLVRRTGLPGPDIGFAMLKRHEGLGYATEAARTVIEHARKDLGITTIYGITQSDNARSIRTLRKLGLRWLESRSLVLDGPILEIFVTVPTVATQTSTQ